MTVAYPNGNGSAAEAPLNRAEEVKEVSFRTVPTSLTSFRVGVTTHVECH